MEGFESIEDFQTLWLGVQRATGVGVVQLNRPDKSNAMSMAMVDELPRALSQLDAHDAVRAVVLCAAGRNFCAGLDFETMQTVTRDLLGRADACPAETRKAFLPLVQRMQDACSCFERCSKPVVAAVQGACVGAGVDIITACDVRVCAPTARFCVKEVDLAITADLGTLQRLPHIVGGGRARELALTARAIGAAEAREIGLVTRVAPSEGGLAAAALEVAAGIARKPALAAWGTKRVLVRGQAGSVQEGLEHVALWNAAMLWSRELQGALRGVPQRARL